MRTFALFGAKTLDFSKFMVCPHSARTRAEGEVNFSRFCADVFYGRPISKLSYHLLK